jgi:hypothetical protein
MTTQQQVTAHIESIMGEQHTTRTGTREEVEAWIDARLQEVAHEYDGEIEQVEADDATRLGDASAMWIVIDLAMGDPEPLATAWID